MKIWKVALISILAAILVLGVTLPVFAAPDEAPPVEFKLRARLLRGEVIGIDESSFTIQAGERETEIRVNEGTRYFKLFVPQRLAALLQHRISRGQDGNQEQITAMVQNVPRLKNLGRVPPLRGKGFAWLTLPPTEDLSLVPNLNSLGEGQEKVKHLRGKLKWLRRFGEEVTFDDMAVGDRVVVWVVPNEGEPLAKLVLILAPTAYKRVAGTIEEINEPDMTITLTPLSGTEDEALIFAYDNRTIFVLRGTPFLKEGQRAIVIYIETPDGLLAKRVLSGVKIPEPVE